MEAIRNYLNQIFTSLPDTPQVRDMKEDLLANMEDKYNQLIEEGKSNNEAVGTVIAEFGNLDELIKEFNIDTNARQEDKVGSASLPLLTEHEVDEYMTVNRKIGMISGLATVLCVIGVAVLILMTKLIDEGMIAALTEGARDRLTLMPLFLMIAIAAGMFVYAGMVMNKYIYIESGVQLPTHLKLTIEHKYNVFYRMYTKSLILGVVICILSPILILGVSKELYEGGIQYGVVILLLVLAVAIYIFIYYGCIFAGYKKILGIEEYSEAYKKEQDDYFGK